MATKFGRVVTYHKEFPLVKLLDPSVTCFCDVTWYIKYFTSPLALDQWPPNVAKVVTHREKLPPINSHNSKNMCSREVTWQIKNISTISVLMVTRPIRVVIYLKELPTRNSHNPSMRWSCEVT